MEKERAVPTPKRKRFKFCGELYLKIKENKKMFQKVNAVISEEEGAVKYMLAYSTEQRGEVE